MNPLTLIKRIQNITAKEASLGLSDDASWHAKYRDSAYVYVGGIPFDLTEGDLLAVFSQYGEVVDVNLVRDAGTGKSKGFAFLAYQDQRSTTLAVDNLNGAQILGRTIRVDHVSSYKKREEEDEETKRQKREERGVCRAFQRGECTRGAACKFSHDEKRAANTGWGEKDKEPRWGHDRFDGPKRKPGNIPISHGPERTVREGDSDSPPRVRNSQAFGRDAKQSYKREDSDRSGNQNEGHGPRKPNHGGKERSPRRHSDFDHLPKSSHARENTGDGRPKKHDDDGDRETIPRESRESADRNEERRSRRRGDNDDDVAKTREDPYRREEKRSRRGEYEDKRDEDRSKRSYYNDVEPRTRDWKEDMRLSGRDSNRYESRFREDNGRNEERRSRSHREF